MMMRHFADDDDDDVFHCILSGLCGWLCLEYCRKYRQHTTSRKLYLSTICPKIGIQPGPIVRTQAFFKNPRGRIVSAETVRLLGGFGENCPTLGSPHVRSR